MVISQWPLSERPREKLLSKGAAALSDAELLAIMLRTGTRGKTALDLGRELLASFGGLRALLEADLASFCEFAGAGPAAYAELQAALQLSYRYLEANLRRGDALRSPDATRRYLRARLRPYQREVFACLFLDNRHRIISFDELFFGTIDGANVHPREVVKRALSHNAAAVILAHNHPSGVAEPSRSDTAITTRITSALALIDVRVLDHIIVGDADTTSLAERGLMDATRHNP